MCDQTAKEMYRAAGIPWYLARGGTYGVETVAAEQPVEHAEGAKRAADVASATDADDCDCDVGDVENC